MPTLDWLTRDSDIKTAGKAPYRLLEAVPEHSAGTGSDNMLIQGDNLEALKALLPYYGGRVKCIYIDPPFNTKQAFEHYDDSLEHSIWLSIMYPRLELLRELLSEQGAIFVHIDDHELGYMLVMLDEVFGRNNKTFIITFKQGSATGHKAINPGCVSTSNYIIVYAKNKEYWTPKKLFVSRDRNKRYNQFIKSRSNSCHKWEIIPLSKAFADYHGMSTQEIKRKYIDYEARLDNFVFEHAESVAQLARPDYRAVSAAAREMIDRSKAEPKKVFLLERKDHSDMYFIRGERIIFYKDTLKEIDGELVPGEPLTTIWDDLPSHNLHNEGDVKFPKGKKPEALIKRIIELCTNHDDLVLDSFLGSGTTAAVAHKMGRRYIGIEMGEHAVTHCAPRIKKVIEGEEGGISKAVGWKGGGDFRFYRLGEAIFDEDGRINPKVRFPSLAAHVWFTETGIPYVGKANKAFLGVRDGVGYALLYNGILGDKRVNGGNVLTRPFLKRLYEESGGFSGPLVIYGEMSRISEEKLRAEKITFKQTPYDVRAR